MKIEVKIDIGQYRTNQELLHLRTTFSILNIFLSVWPLSGVALELCAVNGMHMSNSRSKYHRIDTISEYLISIILRLRSPHFISTFFTSF